MNKIVNFRLCKLSDFELADLVDKATDEMYKTGKLPPRHIPARLDYDFDLLVGELVFRFLEKCGLNDGDMVAIENTDGDTIEK